MNGVSGTSLDLLQHLNTSLQVGRLSRAEKIIQSLASISPTGSAELLYAHHLYLDKCLKELMLHGRSEEASKILQSMQRWFEVEVRDKGVFVDAQLLVVMIRASIRALEGSQRHRAVRRYTKMADGLDDDQYIEVLESDEYDDNEFAILSDLTSTKPQPADASVESAVESAVAESVQYRRKDELNMDEIPEVLATEQRGQGLENIKRSLQEIAATPSLSADASIDQQREQATKRQKILELTSVDVAIDRWRKSDEELRKIGIHTSMQSRPIGALMWQWHQALLPALEAELAECRKLLSEPGVADHDRYHYGPYLELLPLEKISANTILYTLSKMNSGKRWNTESYDNKAKLAALTIGLAKAIEQECRLDVSGRGKRRQNARDAQQMKQTGFQSAQGRKPIKRLSKAQQERQAMLDRLQWPLESQVKFGSLLIAKLMETAKLPVTRQHPRTHEKVSQMQPAFLHRTEFKGGKRVGMVCCNPALVDKIEKEPIGSLIAKRMPMVVEPKPWKGWSEGGYLQYSTPVLRLQGGDLGGKDYFLAAHKKGNLNQVYAGLTALGAVPWKIHHGVFKVQLDAWNSGEPIANFAPLNPIFDAVPEPDTSDALAKRKWVLEMRDIENKRSGLHSQRCFQNFQLEIARTLVNETLYFPHNMDFRGRAYPIPPYLNHMGADNVRGLLVFARGKPLGSNGLRWLKIHLATVAGHDKASMAERVEFTMANLDDIYDSVRNPLTGRRWWLKAEDAWQTLAACFELVEALESPDPTKFISHLPVQQDGTCNGLQHYAALGGDKIGAAQVNLEPGDRPADVYTAVAEAVKREVHKDAEDGNIIAQKLDGALTRKCVKQPVMTNVYGVTWYGAKEQVHRQLEAIFPDVKKYDTPNLSSMSQYVATKIFKSLGEMFAGAQAIQSWLGVCADRISTCLTPQQIAEVTREGVAKQTTKRRPGRPKESGLETSESTAVTAPSHKAQQKALKPLFKSTVVWTTPLRLPVVQPYRSASEKKVNTKLQNIQIHDPQVWHPVSKRKQLQAFPPNFIHSLDATHMLLSALKCKELGMTFASIHDSFWTHACDVDNLSRVLRDAFIEMHKDNIVGRLHEEFETRYQGCMHLATVLSNSKIGKRIAVLRKKAEGKSDNFGELAKEVERLKLLNSDDPDERAKGAAMVTPGSILESEGNDENFAAPTEIQRQQLGVMLDDGPEVEATNSDPDAVAAEFEGEAQSEADHAPNVVADAVEETREDDRIKSLDPEKPKKSAPRKIFVWRPLNFPPIPPRGTFDVRKIRDSAYFFH